VNQVVNGARARPCWCLGWANRKSGFSCNCHRMTSALLGLGEVKMLA
jgi:hypothetical protein